MTLGAFQSAVARAAEAVSGQVVDQHKADIETFILESTSVSPGVVVSRGTAENQAVVGVSTEVLGIVVRTGDNAGADGSESTNTPVYAQYDTIAVLRAGEIWATVTGTGSAGATTINANDTTGAIDLGAADTGETALTGIKLETTMAAAGVARLRLDRNAFGV
jgi:hypothetical protein